MQADKIFRLLPLECWCYAMLLRWVSALWRGEGPGPAPSLHLPPELLNQVGVAGLHLLSQLLTGLEVKYE